MLVERQWIDDHANLPICGPSIVGKSWLASALGNKACRDNRSVLYQRVPRLFSDLALARGDGRHPRLEVDTTQDNAGRTSFELHCQEICERHALQFGRAVG
jgi:IstB-like ATP binding protein